MNLDNLRVSLTKNGYQKIPVLVQNHRRDEILDNVRGVHRGINLARSQVANILGEERGSVPTYWDRIREQSRETIDAFTFLAIVFSHHRLITALVDANQGRPTGYLSRNALSPKEYTNLAYAMGQMGLCVFVRNAKGVIFDLSPLITRLRPHRSLVQQLLRDKLRRCGWRDPDQDPTSSDAGLLQQCLQLRFHRAFGLSSERFAEWLIGRRK